MHVDVTDLRNFYATPLGQVVRRVLTQRVRAHWRSVSGQTLIGLGYACPYLGHYRGEAARLGAFMPEGQGAIVWPRQGSLRAVLVEEDHLPLPDNAVDRLLAVHALEVADRPGPLLRELWRVLTPEGRLLLVVPNRRGMWARTDATPFGHGRPYTRGQLESLLAGALLAPVQWSTALHFAPLGNRMLLRSAAAWERIGAKLNPPFGGVILVEAKKLLEAPIGKAAKAPAIRELVTVR
jgi:SAM-dependent methyltransferase